MTSNSETIKNILSNIDDTNLDHVELVLTLTKPGNEILKTLNPSKVHLLHMAFGIAGEAGELLDAIKKATIYNKPLDLGNVIEELGDLEFYMQGLRIALAISRAETLQNNIVKLKERYHSGTYTDKEAQERADKKEEGENNTK